MTNVCPCLSDISFIINICIHICDDYVTALNFTAVIKGAFKATPPPVYTRIPEVTF